VLDVRNRGVDEVTGGSHEAHVHRVHQDQPADLIGIEMAVHAAKSLTSVAIGRLVQDGRLDLDSPVQRYVPGFPEKRYPISVRQVAGHLAGIRHYDTGEFENREHYATVTESLAIFAADSHLFEPGTQFNSRGASTLRRGGQRLPAVRRRSSSIQFTTITSWRCSSIGRSITKLFPSGATS
jgi:hypothetical protein